MAKVYSEKIRRDPGYFKPDRFRHYLTLKELAIKVGKDPSWIRKLERDPERGFPQAVRVQRGELPIRLYSPEQVRDVEKFFSKMKPGKRAS